MNRRTLVRDVASVGSIGLIAGCLGTGQMGSEQQETTTSPNCPTFGSDVDSVVCANGGTPAEQPVYIESDEHPFTVATPTQSVETLGLTLHNQADEPFVLDPGGWVIVRREAGTWSERASGERTDQSITVAPASTHRWSLSLTPHPTPRTEETTFITADLESGTYLFAVVGQLEGSDRPRRIECHTQFELVTETTTRTPSEG